MSASRRLRVRAHAKINLMLRVGPRQPDGYHPLTSVFQSLALHDTLVVRQRKGPFALACRRSALGRHRPPRRDARRRH
jgi:4-diphosphocytidyl-2C-methyl-D-erythritol kinase